MQDTEKEIVEYDSFTVAFDAEVSYKSKFYITSDISKEELIKLLNTGGAFMSTAYDLTDDDHCGSLITRIAHDDKGVPYLQELARVYHQEVETGRYGEFKLVKNEGIKNE